MPKITVAAGASNALGAAEGQAADDAPAPVVAESEPSVPEEEAQTDPVLPDALGSPAQAEPAAAAAEAPAEAASAPASVGSAAPAAPKKRVARKTSTPSSAAGA